MSTTATATPLSTPVVVEPTVNVLPVVNDVETQPKLVKKSKVVKPKVANVAADATTVAVAADDATTVAAAAKPKVMRSVPAKYSKFIHYVYWLLGELQVSGEISDTETIDRILNATGVFGGDIPEVCKKMDEFMSKNKEIGKDLKKIVKKRAADAKKAAKKLEKAALKSAAAAAAAAADPTVKVQKKKKAVVEPSSLIQQIVESANSVTAADAADAAADAIPNSEIKEKKPRKKAVKSTVSGNEPITLIQLLLLRLILWFRKKPLLHPKVKKRL